MFAAIKQNKHLAVNLIAFGVAALVLTLALGIYLRQQLTKSVQTSTEMAFSTIYETVTEDFNGVLKASQSLGSDAFLIDSLEQEPEDPEAFRVKASSCLSSLSSYYGWSTMYIVSDATMRYYLPDGSVKVLDPENDTWDQWYTSLKYSRDEYHVDVDVDKHNTDKWTIFVDAKIVSPEGKYLGLCGIGLDMQRVTEIAKRYDEAYGVKVSFVSDDGTVSITAEGAEVSQAKRDVAYKSHDTATGEATENGYRVSRYLPLIGWHLVVENNQSPVSDALVGVSIISFLVLSCSLVGIAAINTHIFSKERKALTDKANTDALTGLLNRAGFEARLDRYFAETKDESKEAGPPVGCLAIIDLDRFKEVNDTYGHDAGDQVLKDVARALTDVTRDTDVVSRMGGDEFIAYLPSLSSDEAIGRKAEQILGRIREIPSSAKFDQIDVEASIGLARFPKDGTTRKQLYQAADAALYQAKDAGKNCFRIA